MYKLLQAILLLCFFSTSTFSQKCSDCLKAFIVANNKIKLENYKKAPASLNLVNCNNKDIITFEYPIIGFEDEDDACNIYYTLFKKNKTTWKRITFNIPEWTPWLSDSTVILKPNDTFSSFLFLNNFCPINEKGNYLIRGYFRTSINNKFLIVPAKPFFLDIN